MTDSFTQARYRLVLDFWGAGVVLTTESDSPLIVGRKLRSNWDGKRHLERGFKLALHRRDPTAPLSPFYFNFRPADHPTSPGPLTSRLINLTARCMRGTENDNHLSYHAVAGVPRGGGPFARDLAHLAGVPYIPLEKVGNRVALGGDIPKAVQMVLVVDDVLTSGDSATKAVTLLRSAGMQVTDALFVIDRQQGGSENLALLECEEHSVFTAERFFSLSFAAKKLEQETYNNIKRYLLHHSA